MALATIPYRVGVLSRALQPLTIAVGLALGALIGYGLGVMSLPLVLPAMLADLGWSYWHGGLLAAATAGGYITGLVLALPRYRAMPSGRIFQMALLLAIASLIATGAARDVNHLVLLRFASGLAAAALIVSGMRLAASIFVHEPVQSARMLALFWGGLPMGFVVTGLVVPALMETLGARGWPEMWLVLGLLAICACPFVVWSCRHVVSLTPLPARNEWPSRLFVPLIAARAIYAASGTAALTFLALRVLEREAGIAVVAATWITLGIGGLMAPAFWRNVTVDLGAERRMALAIAVGGAGAALLAVPGPSALLLAASVLMGIGGFVVPSMMDDYVKEALPRDSWDAARSGLAVVHGFSQPIGPLLAAWIADGSYGLQASYALTAAALALAAVAALLQQAYIGWQRAASTGPAAS